MHSSIQAFHIVPKDTNTEFISQRKVDLRRHYFYFQPNAAGDTPIHIAAREGLLGLAQSLCAFGCAVDVSNVDGLYPLHLAARNGHKELVRCLCLAGCRIDVKNKESVTPDMTALAQGHGDICELLRRLKRVRCFTIRSKPAKPEPG